MKILNCNAFSKKTNEEKFISTTNHAKFLVKKHTTMYWCKEFFCTILNLEMWL